MKLLTLSALMLLAACAPTPNSVHESGEESIDWGPRISEVNDILIHQGDLARIPEFFTESYVAWDNNLVAGTGYGAIRGYLKELRSAFPDLRVGIEVLVTQGNYVAWIRTHRGTHEGEFMGFPGTGRVLVWQTMVVTRYQDEKVAEEWAVSDLHRVIRAD